jgi:hypothetical protein
MDQIPDLCDDAAYSAEIVLFAALRQHGKFPTLKQLMPGLVPGGGTGIYRGEGAPGSDMRPDPV